MESEDSTFQGEALSAWTDPDILLLRNRNSFSLSQDIEGSMKIKSKFSLIFRYNSGFKRLWDISIALVAFCNGFMLPYSIAFDHGCIT